ncbi:unnamed protein product [Parascedosporium putredinis]|uniref:Secreted protein n=1 Tax=Parascedosporium putredinis TaxID=1442378 RepID=A0A9P1GWJ9_9PEZI|nr:unnamed protein product [Parascedosporium putredinis]CAI7988310.1 unnamed protein product [Parascedosporium putredinis]
MRSFALLAPALAAATPILNPQVTSDLPDPTDIQIISATWSGNGCPSNSVSTSISPDRTVITFGFDAFQTYIGPGVSVQENNKNCALHLNLKYPGGFQFAVVDSTYHGFALLEEGVTGSFFSTYFFSQDASATTTTRTVIEGGGIWADGQVYTKADSPEAFGSITDDDATIAFTQQLNLNWRNCPE